MRQKRLQKIVTERATKEKASKQSKRTSYWGSHLDTSFSLLVLILSICYYYFGIDFKYGVFKYRQVLISLYYSLFFDKHFNKDYAVYQNVSLSAISLTLLLAKNINFSSLQESLIICCPIYFTFIAKNLFLSLGYFIPFLLINS